MAKGRWRAHSLQSQRGNSGASLVNSTSNVAVAHVRMLDNRQKKSELNFFDHAIRPCQPQGLQL
jgi:hypothetical protein